MTKAVLLATASTRANEGTLTHLPATTDTHLGAGVLDAYKAVVLASPNYNNANNSRLGRAAAGIDFAADFQYNFWTRTFTTGTLGKSHLRAVIAWDATPAGCDASGNSCTGSTPDADLDLSLCDDTTGYCTNSNTYDSTWEMVDLAADPTHSYSIHVQKWSTNQPGTYIGVAWYSY